MDLNVIVETNGKRDDLQEIRRKILRLKTLGHRLIALSVQIDATQKTLNVPEPPNVSEIVEPITADLQKDQTLQIHTRLTCSVSEHIQTYKINQSPSAKKYDLLAIRPLNEKMMNQLCTANFECDIISLDLTASALPINMYKLTLTRPMELYTHFELNYSPMLYDSSQRRNTITFGQILVEKTRSRSLILSSGSSNLFAYRAPNDVACIGYLFGMAENRAKEAVFRNGQKVVIRSRYRKNKLLQAVEVVEELPEEEKWVLEKLKTSSAPMKSSTSDDVPVAAAEEVKLIDDKSLENPLPQSQKESQDDTGRSDGDNGGPPPPAQPPSKRRRKSNKK